VYALGLSGNFSTEADDLLPGIPDFAFHDAAACLVRDGELVAAVEEERFNRIKKTTKFPANAIRACLDIAGIRPADLGAVGHYFRQDFVDQSLNELYLTATSTPTRYSAELIAERFDQELGWALPDGLLTYHEHHRTHAAAAFRRSGLAEALVVVMDGRGEDDSGTIFRGRGDDLEELGGYDLLRSLGALYAQGIQPLGYWFGDEYKVMGLAPYGDPSTYRHLFDTLYTLGEKGDYMLTPKLIGTNMVSPTFFDEGFRPRRKGERFTQQHMDYAAGLQEMFENIVLHVMTYWAEETGLRDLCFAGGIAHNSTFNGRLLRAGLFDEVFIPPSAHDAGAAEGAALLAAEGVAGPSPRGARQRSASLGPDLGSPAVIESRLAAWGALVTSQRCADVVGDAARLLAEGKVLGWAHGRSEYGPRALGNRSIVADARPAENKDRINAMVKKREGYRPFAPVTTPEAAPSYFDLPPTRADYDFMSFVVDVRPERRSELGAITHVDGSARLQIVDAAANERFHALVTRFGDITGTPVLLNTSFNNNAEPIVQTLDEAVACFLTTDIDALVVEDHIVRRRPDGTGRDLVLGLRPQTRLATTHRLVDGAMRPTYEVFLDYNPGPRATISAQLHALLAAADGTSSLATLADRAGVELTRELVDQLHVIWGGRLITLLPT
jgi:predicted NodU family carbamoyl transferase